jgi:sec-independent protein translocase protein TatA
MFGFINSTNDLIVIAIVLLIFFGAKRIPELMQGLGRGMRELKRGLESEDEPARPALLSTRQEEEVIEREVRARVEAEKARRRREEDSA